MQTSSALQLAQVLGPGSPPSTGDIIAASSPPCGGASGLSQPKEKISSGASSAARRQEDTSEGSERMGKWGLCRMSVRLSLRGRTIDKLAKGLQGGIHG